MAAYFQLQNNKKIITIHVGEKINFLDMNTKCSSVQCDGDELIHAKSIIGRTTSTNKVHIFVGDNAQEILLNW